MSKYMYNSEIFCFKSEWGLKQLSMWKSIRLQFYVNVLRGKSLEPISSMENTHVIQYNQWTVATFPVDLCWFCSFSFIRWAFNERVLALDLEKDKKKTHNKYFDKIKGQKHSVALVANFLCHRSFTRSSLSL